MIESLSKEQLYQLPCYGKFLSKTNGDHSLYVAIGGCRGAFSHIKMTGIQKAFVISCWIPSKEGVPPWNEVNVEENAAEKIAEVRSEEVKLAQNIRMRLVQNQERREVTNGHLTRKRGLKNYWMQRRLSID